MLQYLKLYYRHHRHRYTKMSQKLEGLCWDALYMHEHRRRIHRLIQDAAPIYRINQFSHHTSFHCHTLCIHSAFGIHTDNLSSALKIYTSSHHSLITLSFKVLNLQEQTSSQKVQLFGVHFREKKLSIQ